MSNTNNIERSKAIQRTILFVIIAFLLYLVPLLLSNKGVAMENNNCKQELDDIKETEKFISDKFHVEINALTELISSYNKEDKANTNLETDITNKIGELKRLISENTKLPENKRAFLSDIVSGFALVNDAYKSMYKIKGEAAQKETITQVGNEELHVWQQKAKDLQSQLMQCQNDLRNLDKAEDLATCRRQVVDLNAELDRIITLAKEKGIRIRKK